MKVIDKLRKLIAHAQSAKTIGSKSEAEAFATKIQELLDAYNLSMCDIDMSESSSTINREFTNHQARHHWQKYFIANLAAINGCRAVLSGTSITIIGTEIDRQIVLEIYVYFEKLVREFADRSLKEWKTTAEYHRKRKKTFHSRLFKKSYFHGFILALIFRFREQHEISKESSSNQTALIFIGNKGVESENWIAKNLHAKEHPNPKFNFSKLNPNAFQQGTEAAESVALTTKIF